MRNEIIWMKDGILWLAVIIVSAVAVLLVQTGGINPAGFTPTATRTPWNTLDVLDLRTPSLTPTGGWFEMPLPTSAWVTQTPTRTPKGWVSPTLTPDVTRTEIPEIHSTEVEN